MSARRKSGGFFHRFIEFVRRLREAIQHARGKGQAGGGRNPGGRGRQQQPQCPCCYRFVPALCTTAEEGAEPCGYGIVCCCPGEHRAETGRGPRPEMPQAERA